MKLHLYIGILYCLLVTFPVRTVGQDNEANHKVRIELPEVVLLGLVTEEQEGTELVAPAPNEAGNRVNLSQVQQTSGVWLNYSSIIHHPSHRRKVVAFIQGEIPAGVHIMVEATEATGEGRGMLGKPEGLIHLSGEPAEVITGIGSCYTGKGANNGHRLTYRLEGDDSWADIASAGQNQPMLHVVYTLTDQD